MNCTKCKARITTHYWIINDQVYCGPSCQRDGKSQFEKTWKALFGMKRVDTG